MSLHQLKPAANARRNPKRIGRGQGSGHGGTATRGNKGAGQRSGTKIKRGNEGGQMPLHRRIPKFGFNNPFRKEFELINLDVLQRVADSSGQQRIDKKLLIELGIVRGKKPLKVLATGRLTARLTVATDAVSEAARKAIEAAGGTVEIH